MTLLEIDIQYISLAITLIGLSFIVLLLTSFKKLRQEIVQKSRINIEGNNLKLQSLERLTLYAERSGLKNLVERTGNKGMSTADFRVENHGSIFLIEPLTSDASAWFADSIGDDTQRGGRASAFDITPS